ncbi:MAG TPA: extracellular solute-binding protein [Acidimicrobiales bacterium]|nr:extracellular solute-binding protein [Acidimicrobiales bacterium]
MAVAATTALSATLLTTTAGATTQDATMGSTASISIWAVNQPGPVNDYMLALAKSFDSAHPGDKVSVDFIANTPFKQKILVAMSAKKPPALFFSWGGGILQGYIKAGDVASLGPTTAAWASSFLPSSLGAVTYDNQLWAAPIQGTQPVFFYYNKSVFKKYSLSFPTTWPQLLSVVSTFQKDGVSSPIILGNLSGWEGLTYLEYLTDRTGGPSVFDAIQSGNHDAWNNPAVIHALTDIQTLVKAGAFETGYDALDYGPETDAMVRTGVGAMTLMGDWQISELQGEDPSFVTNDLGQAPFPTVPGGKGNAADLEGNTSDYLAVANDITPAQKAVAEQFLETEFETRSFAKTEIAAAQVPVIKGTANLLTGSLSKFLVQIYNWVGTAPNFQYSWDQALGATRATPMLTNLSKVFELSETPQQFVAALDSSSSGV